MPLPQSILVSENFLGLWASALAIVRKASKQIIVGRHNVFNLRRQLGFLQTNRLDQNTLIWQQLGRATQIRQSCTRRNHLFEDSLALQLCRWWQKRQIVVGL